MKKIKMLLLLMLLANFVQAEGYLPVNDKGKVEYGSTVEVEGVSKDQLYKRALDWLEESGETLTLTFEDAGSAENPTIVLSGGLGLIFDEDGKAEYALMFLMTIQCEDGKYSSSFHDIYYAESIPTGWDKSNATVLNSYVDNTLQRHKDAKSKREKERLLALHNAYKTRNNQINALMKASLLLLEAKMKYNIKINDE